MRQFNDENRNIQNKQRAEYQQAVEGFMGENRALRNSSKGT